MFDRAAIASATAAGFRRFGDRIGSTSVMLGFDGFIDSIIRVVDERSDADHYTRVATIEAFGRRITAAAGQSTNIEMVTTRRKLGGNGPIMANAMAKAGCAVTYVGALGQPEPDPVFADLANRAEVHSVAEAGTTDALEFTDGKLLMGKYAHMGVMNAARLRVVPGEATLGRIVGRSRLIGMVNWTMLTGMNSIWRYMMKEVLPAAGDGRRLVFIDLADPQKRPEADLLEALELLREFDRVADVMLGLNLTESQQVAKVLNVPVEGDPERAIEQTALALLDGLDLHGVVIHPRAGAAAAMRSPDGPARSARFAGPFVSRPKLSTGAGDNFNAGFCIGRLAELPVEQCLCAGTATSGYYVREGASPTLDLLADFCDALPPPEDGAG